MDRRMKEMIWKREFFFVTKKCCEAKYLQWKAQSDKPKMKTDTPPWLICSPNEEVVDVEE